MKYSKIIEVNQLLLTEEVIQEYKRPKSYEKAKQQALSIAIRRWQIKALSGENGWQHTEPHLKLIVRWSVVSND